MIQFLVKRLIGLVFVVLCVTFITFIMGYLAPGDPIRGLLGQHFVLSTYLNLRHIYGLDLPWYEQYFRYVNNLLHGNLGLSITQENYPVWDILKSGVPVSTELALWALALQLVIGIPLGIISALKAGSWIDTTFMGSMLVFYAIPQFVLAVFVQVIVVAIDQHTGLNWPVSNWGNAWQYSWTDIQFKLLPILVFAATGTAYIARLARTSMLEVLRQDYVRTARAKGMSERIVIYRHAFRNAMIPLLTVLGISIGLLVTGAFFIETIFNVPGIGLATIVSVESRDYPVIQATTVLLAIAVVFGNLLSDIFYTLADPRIKAE
jgi:ABC-type dipeptide/oligopeptide/nickel transport system permease component